MRHLASAILKCVFLNESISLHWRHNDHDGISNHQPDGCLFRLRSKKASKLHVTGLCAGNSPGPVNSPHKWPVTWKMFPFDDVIVWILIKISLNSVPRGPINDIPALVQIMVWCWPGGKPLSEPRMFRLLTHICVTRPQWVNLLHLYMFYFYIFTLVQFYKQIG